MIRATVLNEEETRRRADGSDADKTSGEGTGRIKGNGDAIAKILRANVRTAFFRVATIAGEKLNGRRKEDGSVDFIGFCRALDDYRCFCLITATERDALKNVAFQPLPTTRPKTASFLISCRF